MVWGLCVSKDGTQIMSVSHDMTLRWWNTMTGKELVERRIKEAHTSTIYTASISSDGTLLATGSVSEQCSNTPVQLVGGHVP